MSSSVRDAAILAPVTDERTRRRRANARTRALAPGDSPAGPLTYAVLLVTMFLAAFPLYWMFIVASSDERELSQIPPNVVPRGQLADNVADVLSQERIQFLGSLWNSLVVSTVVTVSVLFFCSLAGFAFARLRFRGSNVLMLFIIGTLMVPNQLGVVALYILMDRLGWNGTLLAVTVPGLVTAFGVFYMRQFVSEAIPMELVESGRVDGASTLRIYFSIVLPALRPALAVLGLLTFAATWNDFIWPLITLAGSSNPTVQVSIFALGSGQTVQYTELLTGATLATIPMIIVFLLAGRQIVAGIMEGAVKS